MFRAKESSVTYRDMQTVAWECQQDNGGNIQHRRMLKVGICPSEERDRVVQCLGVHHKTHPAHSDVTRPDRVVQCLGVHHKTHPAHSDVTRPDSVVQCLGVHHKTHLAHSDITRPLYTVRSAAH